MTPYHPSQLYRDIRSIDPADYQRIIRRYEEMESEIGRLDVVENFELTSLYVDALFETGAYRKHQLMVDLVIHASIHHGIRRVDWNEQDVFEHHLFRKAASAYRIQDFTTAEHVLRELISIDPYQPMYVRFLRTVLFRQRRHILQFGRAACIFCMLMTAFVVLLNLLVVRNFYPEWAGLMTAVSVDIFVIGLFTLGIAHGYAFYLAHRESLDFQREKENKRRS